MANFQTAPDRVLRSIPPWLPADIQDVLRQPGTYALEVTDQLMLPMGNSTWKGPQARLVAVWGGADGQRLDVVPQAPVVRVDPLTPADPPPSDNVYVYLVRFLTDDLNGKCFGGTMLEGRLSADSARWGKQGGRFTEPLRVTFLPEEPVASGVARIPAGGGEVFVNALIAECLRQGMTIPDQIAYTLATAEHEGGLGPPVRESWGAPRPHTVVTDEAWRRTGARVKAYYPYYGRGYVQLTHKGNYARHGRRLGLPLVDDPDLVLHRDLAINVLVNGMIHSFTGAQLSTFINGKDPPDFVNARRVVNALDAAESIAALARDYQARVRARLAALGR
jgi:hypothetical protein